MHKIFLWFYCLPIIDAVLLILMGTAGFLLVRRKYGKTTYWKLGVHLLLFAWIAVILIGTLGQRTEGGNLSQPVLTPFASYYAAFQTGNRELYRTSFMNAVLFYPAGLLGCEVLPKHWKYCWRVALITVLFALVSSGIEYVQYHFSMGLAEADDVIHNTFGTLLGASACGIMVKPKCKNE